LNTNFEIVNKEDNIIFEDDEYIIEGSQEKAKIIKTLDSVYKRI
jgi:hypothetical protein